MTDPFAPQTQEPASVMVGSFSSWTITDDYDPALFSVKYLFSQKHLTDTLAGVFTDNLWTFTANSAFTGNLVPGQYVLDLVVTRLSDDEAAVVRTSTIQCFATPNDRMSHARIMVQKIESILEGRADSDVESYTIKSRSITKMSVRELTDWREYYIAEVGREPNQITGRRKNNNTVKVGFV
ncbi:hypothetical protein QO034_13355 [Sedimentitalea sp. JM2-8]|uniref:Uncharacterized protein n=1 Tax=Sedimentitalea xiamensis TaxID=3050037 RepID=A0ABT7FGM2_9RHOB|nr:hypothetical protein [Sedimentitalea xiamensis]MDK3074103.1 hypothetical protein [Sedimentitalea xiamensis]